MSTPSPRPSGSPRPAHRRAQRALALVATGTALLTTTIPVLTPGGAPAATAAPARDWAIAQSSSQPHGAVLDQTIEDLSRYWESTFPSVYGAPLPGGLTFHAGTPETPPPACGSPGRRSYRGVAGNAFYCGYGDYIAWDDASLFPGLAQRRGNVALALVLAHEVGHAVQARARVRLPSVYQELQADCFAGAWLRHLADGGSPLRLEEGDLDQSVLTVLALRDRTGVDPRRPGAHGNGFDRASSLQLGYEQGAARCAAYPDDPPQVTARAFASATEAERGGDVDLESAISLTTASINAFAERERERGRAPRQAAIQRVERVAPSALASAALACGGRVVRPDVSAVCPERATVLVSDAAVAQAHRQIGDLAVGALIAEAWASMPATVPDDGDAARVTAACWSGSWLGQAARDPNATSVPLHLSPGDLDEAVIWSIAAAPQPASPFATVRAFRAGFEGRGACR